jgi:rubredoxin
MGTEAISQYPTCPLCGSQKLKRLTEDLHCFDCQSCGYSFHETAANWQDEGTAPIPTLAEQAGVSENPIPTAAELGLTNDEYRGYLSAARITPGTVYVGFRQGPTVNVSISPMPPCPVTKAAMVGASRVLNYLANGKHDDAMTEAAQLYNAVRDHSLAQTAARRTPQC